MDMDKPDLDLLKVAANPYYAIDFSPHVFKKYSELGSSEDWVLVNTSTMEEIGSRVWLEEFLDFMSLSRAKYDGHDIVNPTFVINISDSFAGKHEALVSRDIWIQVNEKLIGEIGISAWLWKLLETLGSRPV